MNPRSPSPLRLQVQRQGSAAEVSLAVPSDLGIVGDAVELIAAECRAGPLSPRRLQFNLRTALAEALANAITYGNQLDPAKLVRVRVLIDAEVVHIHVSDDGDGFDPDAIPDPTTPERLEEENGRGLFVLRRLVDHVSFNEKGNSVCLTLRAG